MGLPSTSPWSTPRRPRPLEMMVRPRLRRRGCSAGCRLFFDVLRGDLPTLLGPGERPVGSDAARRTVDLARAAWVAGCLVLRAAVQAIQTRWHGGARDT